MIMNKQALCLTGVQSGNLVIFHVLAIGFGWQLTMYHLPTLPEDTINIW